MSGGSVLRDRRMSSRRRSRKGSQENVLELALRGKPGDPFYMVGRMGDQSVVIRAEKGQGADAGGRPGSAAGKRTCLRCEKGYRPMKTSQKTPQSLRPATENNGGVVGLDRAAHDRRRCVRRWTSARRCWTSGRTWPWRGCSGPWTRRRRTLLPLAQSPACHG